MTASRRIALPSGRWTGITGLGDPLSDRLVVFCHPMPGAGGFDPDPPVTTRWGVHLLAPDRPGYGASEPWRAGETPSTTAWADDVGAWVLATLDEGDQLSEVEYRPTIGVLGWGAGGAYAISLAARLGSRVDRIALVGTRAPAALRRSAEGEALDEGLYDDRHPVTDRRLGRMFDAAREQGEAGRDADAVALSDGAWARQVSGVTAPALLVHTGSRHVRSKDSAWFRHRLPHARAVVTDSRLPIVDHWDEVLAHLAPDHGDVPDAGASPSAG